MASQALRSDWLDGRGTPTSGRTGASSTSTSTTRPAWAGRVRRRVRATDPRDVASSYPAAGDRHGFDVVVRDVSPGWHTVWVYGINRAGGGENPLLAQRHVFVPSGKPIGTFDGAHDLYPGKVWIRGWAVVTTSSLPVAVIGKAYTTKLAGTGGTGVYTWSLASGAVPDGLSLTTSGVISGTATAPVGADGAGTRTLRFVLTDTAGLSTNITLNLTIRAAATSRRAAASAMRTYGRDRI